MRNFALNMLALGILSASAVAAQADQVQVNPGATYYSYDNERGLKDGDAYTVSLEYISDANWGVSATALTARPQQESGAEGPEYLGIAGLPDPDQYGWHVDGVYYLNAGNGLKAYVAGGAGEMAWDYDSADHVETQLNAGGGIRYSVAPNTTVNAEVRVFHGLDDETFDQTMSVGVAYAFDVSKPTPAPKPTPVATPVPTAAPTPPPAPPVVIKKTVETIRLNVQFPTASSVVAERYVSEIQKAADFLKKHSDVSVVVEGHTDNVGKDEYNRKLSDSRANAVRDVLIKRFGIDAKRTSAIGYGKTKPIATNDTPAGRQENRRVVAVMQKEVIVKE